MNEDTQVFRVDGGRIEVWKRDDDVFGVSLLADGETSGTTYMPNDSLTPTDFPSTYDVPALEAWGRNEWKKRSGH